MATDIVYVELEDALWLHFDLMRRWAETRCGLDHRGLLESALGRPKHAALYESAEIVEQAAALCFGLIKNHPWFADMVVNLAMMRAKEIFGADHANVQPHSGA